MPGASRSSTARVASGVTSRATQSRAAGGEHEIGDVAVAPGEELAHDGHDVVGHDERARATVAAVRRDPGGGGVARAVGPLAARAASEMVRMATRIVVRLASRQRWDAFL